MIANYVSLECECGNSRNLQTSNEVKVSAAGRTVLDKGKKSPRPKIYHMEDCIDFGKQYVGRTVEELLKKDLSYAKWCLEKTFFFRMYPDEIEKWNERADPEQTIGSKYRKMNMDNIEKMDGEQAK